MKTLIRGLFGFAALTIAAAAVAQSTKAPADVYDLSSFGIPPVAKQKTYAGPYDAPTPQLGCKVFDARGRALDDSELTDKQRYQVQSCLQTAQANQEWEQRIAENRRISRENLEEAQRRVDELANMKAAPGTPGPILYPLPANTPTIILQTQ
ncbi:hypothetical protein [Burkholderia stagnalis]|uniref:hypothetical protein n=1 Tax=Burkholderia stagnalis TaxID=1503054 RepID=UPI00075D7A58|nr:hypothetical protein [Burkholderia stagnalis]KVL90753.1 hypothetical protein WT02_23070 [Burkholderia stagnalis]KVL93748.1 hypothetical protein WT03_14990 [Burkholderia stagnalis]KVM02170.1 hypothetical protein WT04_30745 [Burkholderia stagnalis]